MYFSTIRYLSSILTAGTMVSWLFLASRTHYAVWFNSNSQKSSMHSQHFGTTVKSWQGEQQGRKRCHWHNCILRTLKEMYMYYNVS